VKFNQYHCRGFSLLEVLVAFSILALSLGVLYQIFSKGTHATILGKEYAYATIIAQSKLDTFGVTGSTETSESQGIEDNKYQWEVVLQPITFESASTTQLGITLHKIDVEVMWKSLGKHRSVTLNSLKFFPEQ